ncbi:MAG: hypothetical protein MUQ32_17860 [Chloroflexi bacterium]|nr:hypothetical protein [Chloroflexota bacterium]
MTDPLESPTVDAGATVSPEAPSPSAPAPDLRPRPLIERIGMAAIALVIGALFVIVAVAAFVGGEPFLGVMGAAGAVMVLWLGGLTLIRG